MAVKTYRYNWFTIPASGKPKPHISEVIPNGAEDIPVGVVTEIAGKFYLRYESSDETVIWEADHPEELEGYPRGAY